MGARPNTPFPLKKALSTRSFKVMRSLSINIEKVRSCIENEGMKHLAAQRDGRAWASFALRINEWRFAGLIEPMLVARAVCTGFVDNPAACDDPDSFFVPVEPFLSFSLTQFLAGLSILIFGIYIYHTRFKNYVRRTLQEEVMLEVQSQMAEYKSLTEDEETGSVRVVGPKRLGRLSKMFKY